MRRFALAVAILMAAPSHAIAQQPSFAETLTRLGAVESLSQEMWLKWIGAGVCRIERQLPSEDMIAIFVALKAVDAEAVSDGRLKAELMIRGMPPLRPGSMACKVIADKIEEAKPTYSILATAARKRP
jgi:hypothetical protein